VGTTPEGIVKVSATVAPSDSPDIVQVNQPNGVVVPFGTPPGAVAGEKFVNVPALVVTVNAPCVVTTLQLAPLQLVIAGMVLFLELHAVSTSSEPRSATPPIRRSAFARIGLRSSCSSDRRQRRLCI
jgi:hypothetical protein